MLTTFFTARGVLKYYVPRCLVHNIFYIKSFFVLTETIEHAMVDSN